MTEFVRKVRLFSDNRMEVLDAMAFGELLRVLRILDLPVAGTMADGETPVEVCILAL